MKKICEDCNPRYCPYNTRGTKDYCVRVQDYEKGYADAVEKACKFLEECGGYVVNGQKCNYDNFMKAMEEEQ